jgi:hypothetical protein
MSLSHCTRKTWQRGGLYAAATAVALMVFLELLNRAGWWYQETIWYGALAWLNYPAVELQRIVLNELQIPRIYDIPLSWRELVVIKATQWGFTIIWWFLLGAAVSTIWQWLKGNRGR